jgi:ribosomal protein S18 acetylase RimI-like enzyme
MKKSILFVISFLIGVCGFVFYFHYFKKHYGSEPAFVLVEYNDGCHKKCVEDLMDECHFWLFHDPDYLPVKSMIMNNISSCIRLDTDFSEKPLSIPYHTTVACDSSGRVVGFVTYYVVSSGITDSSGKPISVGRVHLLAVTESSRRLGVANALMEKVLEVFRAQRVSRAYLITRPENTRAKNLYHRFLFFEQSHDGVDIYEKNGCDVLVREF